MSAVFQRTKTFIAQREVLWYGICIFYGDKKHLIMNKEKKQQTQNEEIKVQGEENITNGNQQHTDATNNKTEGNGQTKDKTDDAPKEKTPGQQIEDLENKVKDLNNKLLYKVAEFDNYRKRTLKEKADLILNGGEKVLQSLLPVVDDMERAEQNIAKATDVEALKQGLQLVFQKLEKTLRAQGLKKIDAIGQDFNTDYHEAVAFVPCDDKHKGKVIDCIQNGYMLNDKVIRFAKVAVGQASQGNSDSKAD